MCKKKQQMIEIPVKELVSILHMIELLSRYSEKYQAEVHQEIGIPDSLWTILCIIHDRYFKVAKEWVHQYIVANAKTTNCINCKGKKCSSKSKSKRAVIQTKKRSTVLKPSQIQW